MKRRAAKAAAVCLALAMAILTALPCGAVCAGTADAVTEINDVEGLLAMADQPDGNYRLAADLDLGTIEWQPMAFRGTFDGGGHTLYNLRVTRTGEETRVTRDGNNKPYDTALAGFFSALENASVAHVKLIGAEVAVESDSHCFAAILAGCFDHSTLTDCTVQGRVRLISSGVNAGVGGLAGYGSGTADGCHAEVELVFEDRCREARCEQFMGGILACGIGTVTNCTVSIDGYDSCHGFVHNGGLIGMYDFCGYPTADRGDIVGNHVEGRIRFFEDNPVRRAYCDGIIGERLAFPLVLSGNTQSFLRDETKDYSTVLSPEQCTSPQYTESVTAPSCREWGYTEHSCEGCGYHWRDTYTAPRHTPGDWVTVSASDGDVPGQRRRYCTVCGEITGTEPLPVSREPGGLAASGAKAAAASGGLLVLFAAAAGVWKVVGRRKNKNIRSF